MVGVELAVLPSGFGLPPLPYAVGLVLGTLIVGVLLVVLRPAVTSRDVLALGVWMAVGATWHALAFVGALPADAAHLLGAPAVYLTTFVVVGALWLVATVGSEAELFSSTARILASVGVVVWTASFANYVAVGLSEETAYVIDPFWPVVGLFVTVVVSAAAVIVLALVHTEAVATTGRVGAFVVFAHTLDGVSTAIGVDVLGTGEQTPLPRLIMEFAAGLPTAQHVGVGWLFVLTKILLALVIVAVFADYLKESPSRGHLALALMAAVGFGPGVYNLLLFMLSATPA
jgi:uncharacterized membrane protein